MTFNSTSAFEASEIGLPTIFIGMFKEMSPNEIFLISTVILARLCCKRI